MPWTKEDVFKFYEIDRLNKLLDEQKKQTGIMERQERARKVEADRVEGIERAQRHDAAMARQWGQDWKTPAGQRRIYVAKMVAEWGPDWNSPQTRILRQKKEDEAAANELAELEAREKAFADEELQTARAGRRASIVRLTLFLAGLTFLGFLLLPVLQSARHAQPSPVPANRPSTAPKPQPTVAHAPLAADTAGIGTDGLVSPSDPPRDGAARILEGGEPQAGAGGEPPRAGLSDDVSATTQEPAPEVPKELLKAATNGSVPAQYALGSTLEAQNAFREARGWLLKAASSGYAGAQFKLGEFAEKGLAGDRDLDDALLWYEKAAAQGFEPAKQALARLGSSR